MGAKRKSFGISLLVRLVARVDTELIEQNRVALLEDEDAEGLSRSRFIEQLLGDALGRAINRRRDAELEINGAIAQCITGCWIKDRSDHHSSSDGVTLCGSCADSMTQEVIDPHNAGRLPEIKIRPMSGVSTNEDGHYVVARGDVLNADIAPAEDSPLSLEVDGERHIVFVFDSNLGTITFARCNVATGGEIATYI